MEATGYHLSGMTYMLGFITCIEWIEKLGKKRGKRKLGTTR